MLDIVTAVNEMIRFGNLSAIFAPVCDEYFLVQQNLQFLSEPPREALRKGNFKKVPILTGIMTEEGILMAYFIKSRLDRLDTADLRY